MLSAELASNLWQRSFSHVLGQIHGDLTRIDDRSRIVFRFDFNQAQTELLGNHFLNGLDGDLAGLRVDEILQNLLRVREGNFRADQGRVRDEADESAFELANVGTDILGDVESYVGGKRHFFLLGFLLQDGDFGFEVGGLNVGDQSPLEAAAQAVFDLGQFFGRAVAGDNDLLHRLVQGVEGVEEFFLGALFAGEELDVVDEQDVDVAELVAERRHLVVAQRVDHVVGELLAGGVADGGLRQAALDLVSDGLHEVSLAHADAAVEEQRVVGLGGPLGDGLAGGVGELVAAADDEGVEGVARVQLRGAVPVETRLRRARGHGWGDEAAIVADGSCGRIVLGRDELYVVEAEAEIVDGFLDEVGVFVAGVAKLDSRNANEENASAGVAVAGGLEPGVVGMAVDFLFQRIKDARPRIRGESRAGN